MEPHVPSIGARKIGEGFTQAGDPTNNVWAKVQKGGITRETAWFKYKATLELVLEDIELLLSNVDANRVLITSDHGNAIGEQWLYDQTAYVNYPSVWEMSWYLATASDDGTHTVRIRPDQVLFA